MTFHLLLTNISIQYLLIYLLKKQQNADSTPLISSLGVVLRADWYLGGMLLFLLLQLIVFLHPQRSKLRLQLRFQFIDFLCFWPLSPCPEQQRNESITTDSTGTSQFGFSIKIITEEKRKTYRQTQVH